ncbi:HdeD family acid-resistance protein [Corynebacterium flavescens]
MFSITQRAWNVLIFTGIAAAVFGIIALIWPAQTALTLVLIWGWYAFTDGVIELVAAFRPEGRATRGLLVVTGIVGVLAGLVAIFRPLESAVALAWVLGIWLLVRGVSSAISAFSEASVTPRWTLVLGALCFVVAGLIFIMNPGAAALTLSMWLGALALVWGVSILVAGFALHRMSGKEKAAV